MESFFIVIASETKQSILLDCFVVLLLAKTHFTSLYYRFPAEKQWISLLEDKILHFFPYLFVLRTEFFYFEPESC